MNLTQVIPPESQYDTNIPLRYNKVKRKYDLLLLSKINFNYYNEPFQLFRRRVVLYLFAKTLFY